MVERHSSKGYQVSATLEYLNTFGHNKSYTFFVSYICHCFEPTQLLLV
jgi:hypothetical protein